MKQETIKILKIEVGKEPYVKEIKNDLKSLQAEIDGLIQPLEIGANCLAIINEEGKINGSQPNRWLGDNDIICGDFFICGDDKESFSSLNELQIEICSDYFKNIPEFTGQEEELVPHVEVYGFNPMGGLE